MLVEERLGLAGEVAHQSGWRPGSTKVFLTFSSAAFQSSPNPIARAARRISLKLKAYSRCAMAINSSGV